MAQFLICKSGYSRRGPSPMDLQIQFFFGTAMFEVLVLGQSHTCFVPFKLTEVEKWLFLFHAPHKWESSVNLQDCFSGSLAIKGWLSLGDVFSMREIVTIYKDMLVLFPTSL